MKYFVYLLPFFLFLHFTACQPPKKKTPSIQANAAIKVDSIHPTKNFARQCGEILMSEEQQKQMAAFYATINGEIHRDMQERDLSNIPEMIYYPVFFHAISENGRANVPKKTILEALQNMNRVYKNNYIQFEWGGYDSIRSDMRLEDLYYGLADNRADDFFEIYNKNKIINVYLVDNSSDGSYLNGFTYPVEFTYYPQGRNRDLICIATRTIDNGKTLIHEMGHFFTLLHTFNVPGCNGCKTDELASGENCETSGDFICDTPADPADPSAVDVRLCRYMGNTTDNEGKEFRPMINNFMSYYEACCDYQFTNGQNALMRKVAMNYRPYLKRKPPTPVVTNPTTTTKSSISSTKPKQPSTTIVLKQPVDKNSISTTKTPKTTPTH